MTRWMQCLMGGLLASVSLVSVVLGAETPEKQPEVTQIQVTPTQLELRGVRDSRRVLVTGTTANGRSVDLTPWVVYKLDGAAAILDADKFLTPKEVGSATLTVTFAGKSLQVPVKVADISNPPVSFIREVEPFLMKTGCNQGACHGGQQGKAGFKLSLRGYDTEYDYTALVDDLAGRRFNRAEPEQSLMLLKPTQGVPHEGGFLFDEDSRAYHLIKQWIAEGCKYEPTTRVQSLEVFPKSVLLERPGETHSHIVIAKFADGTTRDVTREVGYETSNFEIATVDKAGVVTAVRRGEAAILIRYEGAYTTNVATITGNRADFVWQDSPEFNYVDKHVNNKLKLLKTQAADLCTDAEFLRRIMIDLVGVPPTAAQARAFLSDPRDSKTKRDAKIDELLNSNDFAEFWTLKWSDLLMSNRKFITEKGVWAFRDWIRSSILSNKPYDKFVFELMTANGSTFENPAANYYRISRDPKLVMENMTQVFIGTRFMCAQCHDHPFERWTQEQYYELSAYFSGVGRKPGSTEGEEVIYTRLGTQPVAHPRTGQTVQPLFPYEVPSAAADSTDPRVKLATWLTSKDNPYFAKSLTNRYWSYFLGRGIIDPVDDIRQSNPPSNAELLDALTADFIAQGFDLKRLVKTIVSSHTYQRSVLTNQWNKDDNVNHSHGAPRRLGAEQLYDAIMTATGAPENIPGVPAGFRATQLPDGKIDLSFLDMFGRPPRESPCECERTSEVSLSQTLNLINGPTIGDAIAHPQGLVARLVAANTAPPQFIEEIYLSVLNRLPTAEELDGGVKYLAEVGNPQEGGQDLMWALINSPAFLFNR